MLLSVIYLFYRAHYDSNFYDFDICILNESQKWFYTIIYPSKKDIFSCKLVQVHVIVESKAQIWTKE